jgi:predicted DNA-binding protein
MWTGAEIETYERLKKQTQELQQYIPGYVKEIIEAHLKNTP